MRFPGLLAPSLFAVSASARGTIFGRQKDDMTQDCIISSRSASAMKASTTQLAPDVIAGKPLSTDLGGTAPSNPVQTGTGKNAASGSGGTRGDCRDRGALREPHSSGPFV
ncbi:hypothetical protein AURDEDRAFT_130677 [Auricularia subglabra TFB-10046 SS5]|uniref:Uncharacterized protein n=1 Tax=Auricularia subglabra (strain TFB-10046 / SS5) TaxID=717982 RepID=J0LEQ4_AURST|nr:hypothetical protein AURDEDRAFT_130677 [Auricularia subglabra TFB-10046 SS5]